jgi:2-iminobutanoate/2-iminopropanoate deaminase
MNHPAVSCPRGGDTPKWSLPFSPSVCYGALIFIFGQASVDAEGKIVADTFEGEFRRSPANVAKVLEAAGSVLEHVIPSRHYARDAADVTRYNKLCREFFKEPYPARTTTTNCLPPTLRYEIEVVAVRRPVMLAERK